MASGLKAPSKSVRRRLGRGLSSLISTPASVEVHEAGPDEKQSSQRHTEITRGAQRSKTPTESREREDSDGGIEMLLLEELRPNAHQPRQDFDEEAINALAASISSSGVMQPIVVRPNGSDGYEIIAGERRWRAAQLAGLNRIPAIVRDVTDQEAAEFSLIENLQREDLNSIERAEAFLHLNRVFGLDHDEIAQSVGINRSSVTHHMRLNELDTFTKDAVRDGHLSFGHAKALLGIKNPDARRTLAGHAVRLGWSVRTLERRVKKSLGGDELDPGDGVLATAKLNLTDLEQKLSDHLGTKVHIHGRSSDGAGKLVIEFFNLDQFDGLLERLGFQAD